ncbi:8075_t:CDS:10 [Diversispora eburnea]|uniref:type II protein arginine methyltransferase n=1 Tax=Diversispora eburnea TaxID=1213867 RepID=A0A9N8ZDN3_9GLOM|nr:8075_t:CDS:10 [Diversispora eburnea]
MKLKFWRLQQKKQLLNLLHIRPQISKYNYSTMEKMKKEELTPTAKYLKEYIKNNGPISIAQYMREVLTNPKSGYYMKGDVFGRKGDFITSPEISQTFGELIGIWFLTQWNAQGKPNEFQIVELGPGRGTLMDDVLHCYRLIDGIHLIEVSPELRKIQRLKLCGNNIAEGNSCHRIDGLKFFWHNSIEEIPENGWREILVDIDDSELSPYHFQFKLSSEPINTTTTTSSSSISSLLKKFIDSSNNNNKFNIGDKIEISFESEKISTQIAKHIHNNKGASLIIDYGKDFIQGNTLRVSQADLSANVNFQYLKESAKNLVNTYGPITQSKFLQTIGIKIRLEVLLKSTSPDRHESLISSVIRLIDPLSMGNIYKVLAFLPKEESQVPPIFGLSEVGVVGVRIVVDSDKAVEVDVDLPTIADMFCGAGGFSEGARQAGFRVKWGIDKDDSSIETFLYNHHNTTVYNMEINEFMNKKIRNVSHVDVLLAAPPCQGFTGANTRGNIIDMTTNMILVMNIPQALDILRPKVLVFENVKGFFNRKKSEEIYKLFVNDLLDIGYKIKTKILKATDFGVCQRRERFIMLAVPTESNFPCWPEPTHYINSEVSDQARANYREMGLLPTPTVDVAFRGLNTATPNMDYIKTVPYHLLRLKPNQIPSTVLCTINPGWHNIHPTIFRYISPRESARLQSFPDTYEFKGTLASQYRQVGNSVPPLLAKAIIKEIKFVI